MIISTVAVNAPVSPLICFCNNVTAGTLRLCIQNGAHDLDSIYDQSGAGVGPCGGTCRDNIRALIQEELAKIALPIAESERLPPWVPPLELTRAISFFNRRYYWETHEILEELWLVESGKTKIFYQGIIQAAAAFYHVLNANPKGVIKLAEEADRKLSQFLPAYESIPLKDFVDSLKDFARQAKDILGRNIQGFDYDRLPRLQIGQEDLVFSKDRSR